jgi:ERCC4-related helicase
MTASPGSEKSRMEEVCNNLSIEQIEHRNEDDEDVKPYINPIDTTWKWFIIPQEYKYISSIFRTMLEDKLQYLIERGLLRKKHPQWIFKRELINLGEEIRYRLELTMEELRGSLYAALITNPMTAHEISSFILKRIALDERVDKALSSQYDASKVAEALASQESNNSNRIKKKKMELLSVESHTLTNEFGSEIDSAARRIHTLIAKKWQTRIRRRYHSRELFI